MGVGSEIFSRYYSKTVPDIKWCKFIKSSSKQKNIPIEITDNEIAGKKITGDEITCDEITINEITRDKQLSILILCLFIPINILNSFK